MIQIEKSLLPFGSDSTLDYDHSGMLESSNDTRLEGFFRLLRGSKHAIFIAIITGNPLIA